MPNGYMYACITCSVIVSHNKKLTKYMYKYNYSYKNIYPNSSVFMLRNTQNSCEHTYKGNEVLQYLYMYVGSRNPTA